MVTYPKDWDNCTLGALGSVKMCRRVFSHQTSKGGQIPFYKIGTFGGKADAYISRELYEEYKRLYSYPQKGDILLSAAGTIGRAVVFDGKDSYFQDSNIVWLDVSDAKVDKAFLQYFYESYPWTNLEGTTIRRLYNSLILGTSISLPSLPEQKAIAEILSCIDTHIANLTELIEKKKGIRDGALEDLVSGRTRLKGFDGEWDEYLFDVYFTLLSNNTLSRDKLSRYGSIGNIHYGDVLIKYHSLVTDKDEIPRIKTDIDTRSFKRLQSGDVVIADTAEDDTVGKAIQICGVTMPLVGGLHTIVCRPNYTTALGYLGYYINSKCYHNQLLPHITGIKVSSISKKAIKTTVLRLPKSIDEQKAIVEVLSSLDSEIASLEEEKDKMLQIKAGAMDDLLTGRVRLTRQGG
jgi:type I restriction enzyme S subunit